MVHSGAFPTDQTTSSAPVTKRDYTDQLQSLMKAVNISSYSQLYQETGLSEKAFRRLRRGQLTHMQVGTLQKVAEVLKISVTQLIGYFSGETPTEGGSDNDLQKEYERLKQQLQQQQATLLKTFQQNSLQTLEPMLLQWSAAVYAAQQNPNIPAVKILPLMRPVEQLLANWGITSIGQVGQTVGYDPQRHQLLEGHANPGDTVRVRYSGYRHGDRLLYRAKVSLP
jgi:molecular chaperone GrpE (heat shock protein)